jgi:transposase
MRGRQVSLRLSFAANPGLAHLSSSSPSLLTIMSHLSAEAKHHILLEYTPGDSTRSFAALARRHAIRGGKGTLSRWHSRWDRTPASLERKAGSGKTSLLSAEQVQQYIGEPIRAKRRAHRAVRYTDELDSVRAATGTDLSLRTLRRYGKEECGIKHGRGKKRTAAERECTNTVGKGGATALLSLTPAKVSPCLCDDIATLRRKFQRMDKRRLLFLDESALRLSAAPNDTLMVDDDDGIIEATDTSAYAARYDMIAVCSAERVLLPKIFTPKERADAEVKGINGAMLLQYIEDLLAQAVEGLDRFPLTLVLDRAPIHKNTRQIMEAFHDRGSQAITEILLLPPNAAKRLSPLDNAMFHDWKQECRKRCPATRENIEQIMNDAWMKVQPGPHYLHCGLTTRKHPYFDCPAPSKHKH